MCTDYISTFKKSLINRSQGPDHSLLPFMISSTFHNSLNKQFGVLATRHIDVQETFKGLFSEGIRHEEKLVTIDGNWREYPFLGLEGSFIMFSDPSVKRQRLAEILKSVVVDIMADDNIPDLTLLEQAKYSTFVPDLKENVMIVDQGQNKQHYLKMAQEIEKNAPNDLMGLSLRSNTYSMCLIRLPRKSDFYKGAGDDYMIIWRALRISMNEVIEELSQDSHFRKYKIHKDSQISNNHLSRIRLESSIYFNRNRQKPIKGFIKNETEENAFRTFRELQRLTVATWKDHKRFKFSELDIFASQRYFSEITTLKIGEIEASDIPDTLPELQVYEHHFIDSYWEGKYDFEVRIIRSPGYNYHVLLQDLQKVLNYTKTLSKAGELIQFIEDPEVLMRNHVTRNSITAKEFVESAARLDKGMILLANETKATALRFRDPKMVWDKDFYKKLKKVKGIPKTLSFYQKHTPEKLWKTMNIYHSALLIIKDPKLPIETAINGKIGISKGLREGFNPRALNAGLIKGAAHMLLS